MRKRLWQLHSWLGLVAGLGLLVIGLTGSLLIFHEELELLFNPEMVRVEPASIGRPDVGPSNRLPLDTLLAHAQRQLPDHEVTGWLPQYEAPHLADLLYVIERGNNEWLVATLDPYTGNLLASPRLGTTTLTGWLLDLHYMFLADHAGMFLAGLFGVMLCVLGASGVWMYREFWKNFFTLRWNRGARILFSDLHKFTGIASVAFNLILGFTGAYWNLTHLVGHWINGDPPQPKIAQRLYPETLSLDALARDAAQRLPGFRGNFISLPSDPAAPAVIFWGTIEPRGRFTGPYGSTVSYDPQTGAHTATSDLRTQGWWARFADSFTPLHYGTFGGLTVKILWCLGGLTPGLLGITGFLIWLRRRRTERAVPPRETVPEPVHA
jgi:uncharacterized iron-regulated membrane protein